MPGVIHSPSNSQNEIQADVDVVVVGSGPGGAAAAYKLASNGKRVAIIEMGGYFTPANFTRDLGKSLKNLYQDAGQRYTSGNAYFPVMFGKGVGGGTLVNSGISFKPPEKIMKIWESEAGLREFSYEKLLPYIAEVEANVNIEILELGRLGRNNILFKEGAEKLKYRSGVIPRNTKDCNACGTCFFGCPSGAKQSTDKNFISKALSSGADLYTHTQVIRIDVNSKTNRFESLKAKMTDPSSGKVVTSLTVKAKHLVLAAGAIGTPKLLLKDRLANSSQQIGKNFRCHPSTGVVGIFPEEVSGFNSIVQGYYSDHFIDKDILLETYWAPPGVFATFIPGSGPSVGRTMKEFKRFAGAGGMIRDESSGELKFEGDTVEIEYQVTERDQKLLTETLYYSAEILLAAGAKTVYADNPKKSEFTSLDELRSYAKKESNLGPDIIREGNHGMGTCRMGENSKTSVVNSFGRSHDIPNLWVFDVSTFPSALGVNPQITIMSLSLRGAAYLNGNFS